ncbi:MAG: hypothetical protein ACYTGN_06935 [Planctomycetota bacterium]|jgi:hypothetical protein
MSKSVWIAAVLGIGIVVAVSLFAKGVVDDFKKRDARLEQEFEQRVGELRELDTRFPYKAPPQPTLVGARMEPYIAVRSKVGEVFKKKLQEHGDDNYFHGKSTRNDMLLWLRGELTQNEMSFAEYMAITRRWHAILARGERLGLYGAWQDIVTTKEHPRGLPLGEPAKAVPPEELEVMRKHEKGLEETLYADLLTPTLDAITDE